MTSRDDRETQYDMLRRLELPFDAYESLRDHCHAADISFLSTPFDSRSADFLIGVGVDAIKISSADLTDHALLTHLATLRLPLIMSTGMASLEDVTDAISAIAHDGTPPLALLHCVSSYPAPAKDANLRAMHTLWKAFAVPVGYSDHTEGLTVSIAAAALGAAIIEKHITIDKTLPGPDHSFALEPNDFRSLVECVRLTEASLGDGVKRCTAAEEPIAAVARKSLAASRDLFAGTILMNDMIVALRPATGLPPQMKPTVIGRRLCVDVKAGEILTEASLQSASSTNQGPS